MMKKAIATIFLSALALIPARSIRADNAISLTVTPPFFDLNVSPGESWSSSVKMVNTNPGPLPVAVQLVGFEAAGEDGSGRFTPLTDIASDPDAAANWITFTGGTSFIVPPGASQDIPFTLKVPPDASPGGHYVAILVGTAPQNTAAGSAVAISSYISSLFFVKVSGNIQEEGAIKEFSVSRDVYGSPHADFTLRFENDGNVHLHPEGEIAVFDMWGRKQASIPINNESVFGNVLPRSVRKFEFSWDGGGNALSFGRYTANVALTYGDEKRQNVSQSVSFWVIPVYETAGIFGGTLAFILLLTLLVRWNIRRMLRAAGAIPSVSQKGQTIRESDVINPANPVKAAAGSLYNREPATLGPKRFFIRNFKMLAWVLLPLALIFLLWITLFFSQTFMQGRIIEIKNTPSVSSITP